MVSKSALNSLLKDRTLDEVEMHLVYSYVSGLNFDYRKSPILKTYFSSFEKNMELSLKVETLGISTVKELENCLELIIPDSDRKFNGAFFTPTYIIDFIIKEIHPRIDDKNLDPSCGCGAFLIGLVEFYRSTYKCSIREIVRKNVYGSDILAYNVHRTKLILAIYALQFGEVLKESDFNIYHQDSLRAKWPTSFDNIVGNPPYVKFQDLSDDNRNYLTNNWTTVDGGTFNLYFAFFELGYKLLKENGKLGYITPNNYFTSLSGESIRRYFQQKKCVSRIVDFNHKKVFDAQTYTAITFLSKSINEFITFDRIKNGYSPQDFLLIANGSPNYLSDLNVKKWRLLKTDEQKNIKTIETIGTPISTLFDICVGIATLKDEVFFVDGKQEQGNYYLKCTEKGVFQIEKEVTKPVYKISDFKSQEEANENSRRIICPYTFKNGSASPFSEIEFKKKFPQCYAYLLSEKDVLVGRDKGKVKFEPFFIWGRSQGLTKSGLRIVNPTFSQYPRFLVVREPDSYFTNGYGIFFKNYGGGNDLFAEDINPISRQENVDVVQKILNSSLMHYYVSKTSVAIEGGYPCYQKNFIEKFTIPNFSNDEIIELRAMSDRLQIDEWLSDKYQLKLLSGNLV